jgi:hypothetical protein
MKQLSYSNSWESDIYKVDDKELLSLSKVKIGSKIYKVVAEHVGVPYSDMGRPGVGFSTHYFVKEKVFGYDQMFDLNEVIRHKKVYAVVYKLMEK